MKKIKLTGFREWEKEQMKDPWPPPFSHGVRKIWNKESTMTTRKIWHVIPKDNN